MTDESASELVALLGELRAEVQQLRREHGRLRQALVKVRAHTAHLPGADAERLAGLLASIARITDEALG